MGSWSTREIKKVQIQLYIYAIVLNIDDGVEIFFHSPFLTDKSGIDFDH